MAPRWRFASKPPASQAAAIPTFESLTERLKQGNAVELEFIKKLKEGLDNIAAGMQTECLNRSDALSDLRKMLEEAELAVCHAALNNNYKRYTSAQESARADFESRGKYIAQVHARDGERAIRTVELMRMLVEAFPQAREGAETWMHGEQKRLNLDNQAEEEEVRAIDERRNKRIAEARAVYDEIKEGLLTQEEYVKQVAEATGVELGKN